MRVVFWFFIICSFAFCINATVLPQESRGRTSGGRISPVVLPPIPSSSSVSKDSLGVRVVPRRGGNSSSYAPSLQVNVKNTPQHFNQPKKNHQTMVRVVPPKNQSTPINHQNLNVRVYPPVLGQDTQSGHNPITPHIGQSKPITQDMMFYKTPQYKMKIPPQKRRVAQLEAPPPPVVMQDEYEGDDNEPLFVRNRNGVMVGFGIGGSFDRLWIAGSGGNKIFDDSAFAYYFRLGYQHYFTSYLGVRAYANLGDWSNTFSNTFFDGTSNVAVESKISLHYSFFAEVLYDFFVLQNHSFGIFGGFGIGVSYGEFSNDDTDPLQEYFAMPVFSVGFAYTLYENNRFEFEAKIPLREEVLQNAWRAKLSTWMIGVSYTYVF